MSTEINYDIVRATLNTNYYGTLSIMEKFAPIMRNKGRLINISCILGRLDQVSLELKNKLADKNLSASELSEMIEKYADTVKAGTHKENG